MPCQDCERLRHDLEIANNRIAEQRRKINSLLLRLSSVSQMLDRAQLAVKEGLRDEAGSRAR